MKRIFWASLLALSLMAGMGGVARASLLSVGDPVTIGSWSQAFNESNVGTYDAMEAFMVSAGDTFEAPGFSGLASGWIGTKIRGDYIKAVGPDATYMNFNILFDGLTSDPLSFVFLAWDGGILGTLKEAALANWNGQRWSIAAYNNVPDTFNRAPEPASLALLGLGLAGLGFSRRKKA